MVGNTSVDNPFVETTEDQINKANRFDDDALRRALALEDGWRAVGQALETSVLVALIKLSAQVPGSQDRTKLTEMEKAFVAECVHENAPWLCSIKQLETLKEVIAGQILRGDLNVRPAMMGPAPTMLNNQKLLDLAVSSSRGRHQIASLLLRDVGSTVEESRQRTPGRPKLEAVESNFITAQTHGAALDGRLRTPDEITRFKVWLGGAILAQDLDQTWEPRDRSANDTSDAGEVRQVAEKEAKKVVLGGSVIFVDAKGIEHGALITSLHGWDGVTDEHGNMYSINILYVSKEADRTDTYGQQSIHETSVVHQTSQSAHGMYWRHA